MFSGRRTTQKKLQKESPGTHGESKAQGERNSRYVESSQGPLLLARHPHSRNARGFCSNGSGTAGLRVRSAAASQAGAESVPSVCAPAGHRKPANPGTMQTERSIQSFGSRYRQIPFMYDVKRNVYNEENFQQEHRRKGPTSGKVDINITTFKHHVQCRCSWHKFLRCMLTVFPFLEWMCLYRFKDWLLGDLLAGLSVGLVQVPQGLTLSLLTRQLIPPLNVTYAAFCSSVIYLIFGSCHQMSIGPFFLVSALMINVLRERPFNGGHLILGTFVKDDFSLPTFYVNYNRSLSMVASTTFLTGIIQLSMGMLGMGFVATYLPEAATSAYLAAVALHVILAQMTCIFGIMISFHAGPISFIYNIINYCIALPRANSTSILLFLTAVVALRINKCIRISFNRYPIEFPMELLLILGFSLLTSKITMATENSKMLINMIPYSFVFPETPELGVLSRIVLQAMSLALVSSFLLVSLGKKIANLHNYRINSNQDLIAIGLCNVVSSFFKCCVFTGSMARTVIQDKSGGRQQFASLVGAGVMLLLMVKMGSFFHKLPNVLWMVTFSAAIFLGLDVGLLISLGFTFFIITVRSHRTKILVLGQIPNTNIYRNVNDYREVILFPGVKIFQCCNSITFVNVYHLKRKLLKEVNMMKLPLKEEEIYTLFHDSETSIAENKICRCFCDCEELEPEARVIYTERYENKEGQQSATNLVRCSYLASGDTSQATSEEQIPYTVSSTSQRNMGPNYEDMEKAWLPNDPARNNLLSPPENSESLAQSRSRSVILPYSDTSVQFNTHTIILDFSMVHYVDNRALVTLRQMCNAFYNANILVLISGCHTSVVKLLEKNDFFDEGITKAQLFLSLHDAVLFALSRKFSDPSELSIDEAETVIQETYSESDKNDNLSNLRLKTGNAIKDSSQHASLTYTKTLKPIKDDLEFDLSPAYNKPHKPVKDDLDFNLELDPMQTSEETSGMDLNLDLDLDLDQETELDPGSELDSDIHAKPELELESELETDAQTEPETEEEPEPEPESQRERELEPKTRARASSPWRSYLTAYRFGSVSSQSGVVPQTRSAEKRQPRTYPNSPQNSKDTW
ncbi:testis anion transporter 1 isoform X3 [Arvicanthis niloticus]|uniref:testis anion transporter 1 isoform X3 n=1 Tax=Arvicanthis niloticus TaxID=61156 RepID=UPI00402BA3BF